jgi:hypothetical protein
MLADTSGRRTPTLHGFPYFSAKNCGKLELCMCRSPAINGSDAKNQPYGKEVRLSP